jgi:hypothetical protein
VSGGVTTIGMAMTDMSMPSVTSHDVDTCTGGRRVASGLTRWLGLSAAPTFAFMAMWSAFFSGQPDMLYMAMQYSSPMSGMTVMYLLMSAFHLSPWLKLIAGRRYASRRYARVGQLALCFVGIENFARGPAVEDTGELRGEVPTGTGPTRALDTARLPDAAARHFPSASSRHFDLNGDARMVKNSHSRAIIAAI